MAKASTCMSMQCRQSPSLVLTVLVFLYCFYYLIVLHHYLYSITYATYRLQLITYSLDLYRETYVLWHVIRR